MKILHVVQHLKMGGIESLVVSILQADPENTYIFVIEGTVSEALKYWPYLLALRTHLIFADKKSGYSRKVIHRIRDACKTFNISTLHSHHIGPLFYTSMASLRLSGVIHVHTVHDVWHLLRWKNKIIESLIFKMQKRIRLVAVSLYVLNQLKLFFPKKKIVLIHNAVNTDHFIPGDQLTARAFFNLDQSALIIGSAGRLEKIKGHKVLIQAMQKLPAHYYLAIAGEGELRQDLLQQISDLHLSDRVCLLGNVKDMVLFYQACDLFCLPSFDEGLPLVILEAQACRLPVVCSDVGGCSEGVDPASGILVPANNPDAVAGAILTINPQQAKVLQNVGEGEAVTPREFILKNFSLMSLIDQYKKLYAEKL